MGFDESAGWVIRIGEKEYTRRVAESGEYFAQRKSLSRVVATGFNAGAGNFGLVAIHGKCWFANQDMAARFDKRVEKKRAARRRHHW